jgi:hypothetical protein
MGDMKEVFQDMQKAKKERHNDWHLKNLATLSDMEFILKGTVCLFREKDKPKVDFYPHTGRWKAGNKMYKGGGVSFLNWYKKQGDK